MRDTSSFRGQVATFIDDLRASMVFLTRLPSAWIGADPAVRPDFTHAARAFPVAGAIIGAIGGVILVLGWMLGLPALVAAGLAVATPVIVTGALHEDGLADSADGIGGATREQRLDIMADSRIGTYGAVAIGLTLLLRVASLAAILPRGPLAAALVLVAGEALSRAATVRMWHDLPSARDASLSADTGAPDQNATLAAIAIAVVLVVLLCLPSVGWRATTIAALLAVAAGYTAIRIAANALGGRTGDTLGACQQVTLVAFLVGASAT